MILVSVVNQSSVAADADVKVFVGALRQLVHLRFTPVWGIGPVGFVIVPKGQSVDPAHWQLVLLDNADQANALGYHELTRSGLPLGKAFCKTSQQDGVAWQTVACHEMLEMLADPEINRTVFLQSSDRTGVIYPYEICDAVEGVPYIEVDGVPLSNFVLPAYFEPGASGPYDFLGVLKSPLPALASGGYMGEFKVGPDSGPWSQITAAVTPMARAVIQPGSRRDRRALPRPLWRASTV